MIRPVSRRIRFINWCVDTALCGLLYLGLVRLAFVNRPDEAQLRLLKYGFLLLNFTWYLAWETVAQTTPGKWLTGTVVMSANSSPASFATILARTATRFIPFEPLAIFFSSSGQTLHDHLSNTKTTYKQSTKPNTIMKHAKPFIVLVLIAAINTSCATILGGKRTAYQTTKPSDGQPQRKVRVGYILADVFLTGALGLVIDFATGAIYKPSADGSKPATEAN